MLLKITTTHRPATDLGFLLHKHPDKFQSVDLIVGQAHIFYPECSEERTTVALLLEINPLEIVRGRKNFALGQYVNDRPYVASSFMSSAISKAFSTAMNGRCSGKPELVDVQMPFEVTIAVLAVPRGGKALIRKLFEPLGYEIDIQSHLLDTQFEEWGEGKHFTLRLKHTLTLKELLSHLFVLIPTLDRDKHYYVGKGEIDKLLEKGGEWLRSHPEKKTITRRYLVNLHHLSQEAINQLEDKKIEEEKKESLHQKRLNQVLEQLKASGARSVLDLGCGEGKLVQLLLQEGQFAKIAGMDISYTRLCRLKDRLHWEDMAPKKRERIKLFQGALTYKDKRLVGYDAAAIVEVIEHLDELRLEAFEQVVFGFTKPKTVIITTPNREYNARLEGLEEGEFRHLDHRFEWTREEFQQWAKRIGEQHGYAAKFLDVGDVEEGVGAQSQMGVFTYEA